MFANVQAPKHKGTKKKYECKTFIKKWGLLVKQWQMRHLLYIRYEDVLSPFNVPLIKNDINIITLRLSA
jgi:hypothetical protein